MKKIIILGSSPAGVTAAEEIRKNDQESSITMIGFDGYAPYNRDLFVQVLAKDLPANQVYYRDNNFYSKYKIRLVSDKKLSRINFKKKIIFADDKTQFEYDVLIIADTFENRFPDIKGKNKAGCYGLKKFKDINGILDNIPVAESVVIQSSRLKGLQYAFALAKNKKEVILVQSQSGPLTKIFEPAVMQWLKAKCDEKKIKLVLNQSITEILGESDVKAVRLDSSMVYGAQMVIFDEFDEDLRIFTDIVHQDNHYLRVNEQQKTSLDGIYAMDTAGSSDDLMVLDLEEQARVAAAAISGQEYISQNSTRVRQIKLDDLSLIFIGQTAPKQGLRELVKIEPTKNSYKKAFVEGEKLVGAVLINAENELHKFLRLIEDGFSIREIEDRLLESEANLEAEPVVNVADVPKEEAQDVTQKNNNT